MGAVEQLRAVLLLEIGLARDHVLEVQDRPVLVELAVGGFERAVRLVADFRVLVRHLAALVELGGREDALEARIAVLLRRLLVEVVDEPGVLVEDFADLRAHEGLDAALAELPVAGADGGEADSPAHVVDLVLVQAVLRDGLDEGALDGEDLGMGDRLVVVVPPGLMWLFIFRRRPSSLRRTSPALNSPLESRWNSDSEMFTSAKLMAMDLPPFLQDVRFPHPVCLHASLRNVTPNCTIPNPAPPRLPPFPQNPHKPPPPSPGFRPTLPPPVPPQLFQ